MNTRDKHAIFISFIVAIVLSAAFVVGLFSHAQLRLQDTLVGTTSDPRITIIAIDDASIQDIGRWPWNRSVYADLLPKLSTAKAVAIDVVFSESADAAGDTAFADALSQTSNVILAGEYTAFVQTPGGIAGTKPLLPLAQLRDHARIGMVNFITDRDGVVRAANTALDGTLLAEHAAKLGFNAEAPSLARLRFDFSEPNSHRTISFADIYRGRTKIDFSERVVFIGATAPNLHDTHTTPVGIMSGVELQANLASAIAHSRYFTLEKNSIAILLIFAFSLLVGFLVSRTGAWIAAGATLAIIFTYFFIAVLLSNSYVLLDLVFLPLALVCSYIANLTQTLLFERKEKKYIHDAFSRYVAPEVVSQLMKHPEKLKLGGEKREITIFFSDIRGFTSFSEALTPEKLVQLLNEYLTAMTDIIMESGGVVDKYIGDAIMAFWGAPLDQPDHAVRAANAVLAMQAKLKTMQKKWHDDGFPLVEIGSGLNTGDAVIGNMGSANRFNYTCMGDTINLGSRLEGITKEYGVKAIVSESTRVKLDPTFMVRELDLVRVKGKKEPIRIFELVGRVSDLTDKQKHILKHWEAGLAKYRAKEFRRAIDDFAKAVNEGDKTSAIYIERCEHFIKEHPGKDWDCVWVMKTK